MPKLKAPTTQQWTRLLDKHMGKLVRESTNKCDHCGKQYERLEWCHIISRTNKTLRWDIFNALRMDSRCHRFFWHEQPLQATEWFKNKYSVRYKYLMQAKNVILKRTPEDYKEILTAIKEKRVKDLISVPSLLLDNNHETV